MLLACYETVVTDMKCMYIQVEEDDQPLSQVFRIPIPVGTEANTVNSNIALHICLYFVCVLKMAADVDYFP